MNEVCYIYVKVMMWNTDESHETMIMCNEEGRLWCTNDNSHIIHYRRAYNKVKEVAFNEILYRRLQKRCSLLLDNA